MANQDYSTQKVNVPAVSRPDIKGSDLGRVLPRQNSSGSTRGNLTVGQGNINIDGSNDTISIGSNIGTSGIGDIPNSDIAESGFFQTDASNTLIYKLVNGSTFLYNPLDNYVNSSLFGFAPDDGRPGFWVAKEGQDATELLS